MVAIVLRTMRLIGTVRLARLPLVTTHTSSRAITNVVGGVSRLGSWPAAPRKWAKSVRRIMLTTTLPPMGLVAFKQSPVLSYKLPCNVVKLSSDEPPMLPIMIVGALLVFMGGYKFVQLILTPFRAVWEFMSKPREKLLYEKY